MTDTDKNYYPEKGEGHKFKGCVVYDTGKAFRGDRQLDDGSTAISIAHMKAFGLNVFARKSIVIVFIGNGRI